MNRKNYGANTNILQITIDCAVLIVALCVSFLIEGIPFLGYFIKKALDIY